VEVSWQVADLDAGDFGEWLERARGALKREHDAAVPCDGCTACCTSSQFVHIEPDETDTVAHIPLHNQVIPWAMKKNVDVVHRPDNRLDWSLIKVN
jgi:hypothetical protein